MSGSRVRSWGPRAPRSGASAFRSRRRSESTRRIEPLRRASRCKHPKAVRGGGAVPATEPGTRPGRVHHGALRRFRRCKHRRMNPGRGAPVWSALDACAGNRPGCGGPGGLGCKHPRSSVPQAGRSVPSPKRQFRPDPGRVRPVPGGPRRKRLGPGELRRERLGFRPAGDRLARASPRSSVRGPLPEGQAPRSSVPCDPFPPRRKRLGFSVRGCQGWSWCKHPDLSFARRPVVRSGCEHPIRSQVHRCSVPSGCASAPIGPGAQMLRAFPWRKRLGFSRRPASGTRGVSLEPVTRALPRGPSAPALRLHPQVSAGSRGEPGHSPRYPGHEDPASEPAGRNPRVPTRLVRRHRRRCLQSRRPGGWSVRRLSSFSGPWTGSLGPSLHSSGPKPTGDRPEKPRVSSALSVTGEPVPRGGSESDSSHLRRSHGFAPRLPATGGFHRRLPPRDPEASEDSFGPCRHCANPGSLGSM